MSHASKIATMWGMVVLLVVLSISFVPTVSMARDTTPASPIIGSNHPDTNVPADNHGIGVFGTKSDGVQGGDHLKPSLTTTDVIPFYQYWGPWFWVFLFWHPIFIR